MKPKLRLQSGVGSEFSRLECRRNPTSGNIKLRKIVRFIYAVLVETTKMDLECGDILNLETLYGDSAVRGGIFPPNYFM